MTLDRRRLIELALRASVGGGLAGNAVTVGACSNRPPRRGAVPSSPGVRYPLSPSATAELFRPGTRHRLDSGDWAVSAVLPAGVLRLPSGQLVAADPSWLPTWQQLRIAPFTVPVSPGGDYPLTLALVIRTDKRVAAAKLTIHDEPVTAWEFALRPGQSTTVPSDGRFYGVGVDVATIALFDTVALVEMARRADQEPNAFYVEKADHPVELIDPASGANLIAFETGWGDGRYPVWIGRRRDGAVACFLVDMLMLDPTASPSEQPPRSGR